MTTNIRPLLASAGTRSPYALAPLHVNDVAPPHVNDVSAALRPTTLLGTSTGVSMTTNIRPLLASAGTRSPYALPRTDRAERRTARAGASHRRSSSSTPTTCTAPALVTFAARLARDGRERVPTSAAQGSITSGTIALQNANGVGARRTVDRSRTLGCRTRCSSLLPFARREREDGGHKQRGGGRSLIVACCFS